MWACSCTCSSATLSTCLFRETHRWRETLGSTVEAFTRVVPGLVLDGAQPFRGFGSVIGRPSFSDEAGRLFVGEAAGLQDPDWGFGMWYAMESGALAARSLLEEFDYGTAARIRFEALHNTALFNRILYEHLPAVAVRWLLRCGASPTDIRRRVRLHWKLQPHEESPGSSRAAQIQSGSSPSPSPGLPQARVRLRRVYPRRLEHAGPTRGGGSTQAAARAGVIPS